MARRISEKDKLEIIKSFSDGETLDELSEKFKCTKLTISRNLKKTLGEKTYKEIINKFKKDDKDYDFKEKNINVQTGDSTINEKINVTSFYENEVNDLNETLVPLNDFTEIIPLNCEIDNKLQKDLSSVPIGDIVFPKLVYMIVDKKIELETKLLKDYPEWQFLSENESNRKTIEIFFDHKIAKRFCSNEQKVIKVPNTTVFKIVAPILVSRGITRIVTAENLIALC